MTSSAHVRMVSSTVSSCFVKKRSAPVTITVSALGNGDTSCSSFPRTRTRLRCRAEKESASRSGAGVRNRTCCRRSDQKDRRDFRHCTRPATHAPNENPRRSASCRGAFFRPLMAAMRSSCSPSPSSCFPALAPAPRKLNRSVATFAFSNPRAARKTILLCSVPPPRGCGWQMTATPAGSCSSR